MSDTEPCTDDIKPRAPDQIREKEREREREREKSNLKENKLRQREKRQCSNRADATACNVDCVLTCHYRGRLVVCEYVRVNVRRSDLVFGNRRAVFVRKEEDHVVNSARVVA